MEFTESEILSFATNYLKRERDLLTVRLSRIGQEIETVADSVEHRGEGSGNEWHAAEILAHMVTSAQYFGWLAHQVATHGDVGDIMQILRMRDVATNDAAEQTPQSLAAQLKDALEQTIKFLENVTIDDLRIPFDYVGIQMTAEDVIRIPLCSHLESHIDQIKESLAKST